MYIGSHSKSTAQNSPKNNEKHKMGVMNFILIFTAVALTAFTAVMIYVFVRCGSIPDTLCTCVFAALGGECGVMGWIKTNKDKIRDRNWEKEDELNKNEGKEKDYD